MLDDDSRQPQNHPYGHRGDRLPLAGTMLEHLAARLHVRDRPTCEERAVWQEPDVVREDLQRICAARWVPWHALRDRTVLVTGATGLIGRTLTKALLWHAMQHDSGTRVLALVRDEGRASQTFAPALDAAAPLSFLQGDVQALQDVGEPVHLVVHGASVTASREMVTNPVGTIATALRGT